MTFKKAVGVGLVVVTALHLADFTGHISSPFLFPGFLAQFVITGLHGDDGPLGAVASMAGILVNAVFYALLISGGSQVVGRAKRRN